MTSPLFFSFFLHPVSVTCKYASAFYDLPYCVRWARIHTIRDLQYSTNPTHDACRSVTTGMVKTLCVSHAKEMENVEIGMGAGRPQLHCIVRVKF